MLRNFLRNNKAFTLVELVIVLVIIGILAAIAIPKFADLSESAQISACIQNQEQLESACTIFYTRSAVAPTDVGLTATDGAQYPAALSDLVTYDLVDAIPGCPRTGDFAGGSYSLNSDGDSVTCSNGCGD
ncbi:prepilin-type N-terminal cleavage/methylation domain-containing protein [bacterium]|nr:prepilin-type N-terminal cleavage/methylation domain-containing protein [bacterium]